MRLEFFAVFFKLCIINLFTTFIFFKITHYTNISISKKIFLIIINIIFAFTESILQKYTSILLINAIIYSLYSFIFGKFTKTNFGYSLISVIISSSISYIFYSISAFIVCLFFAFSSNFSYKNLINFIIIFCIEFLLVTSLFKVNRFKYGIPFIRNRNHDTYLDLLVLIISIVVIFICCLFGNYQTMSIQYLTLWLILFIIFMLIITQKTFIIYQKQKLLEKTIKDYEQELYEKQTQLETILKEKNNLIKANHEFYHRQKALSLKLDNLMKSKNLLFKEEYGSFVDRIDTLAKEYNNVIADTKISNSIPKTNIPEIDDMFIYMQNECNKNNIEFTLKLTCDAYQLINNIIPKNKLEILIGDLIRNSIIAINHSSNEAKAIMVILGIKNNIYEFSVYDTGIEFQIDTLLKLGKECATTHKDSGGTGIGFITTFETLKYCNASLIITEFSDKSFNYTKSVTIKFDNKNDYIIETYRLHDFYKKSNIRNDLIIKQNSSNPNFSHRQVNSLVYK